MVHLFVSISLFQIQPRDKHIWAARLIHLRRRHETYRLCGGTESPDTLIIETKST